MGHDTLVCSNCAEPHRCEWSDEVKELLKQGCSNCGASGKHLYNDAFLDEASVAKIQRAAVVRLQRTFRAGGTLKQLLRRKPKTAPQFDAYTAGQHADLLVAAEHQAGVA